MKPRYALVIVVVYALAALWIAHDQGIFSAHGYPIHNGGDSAEYATLATNLVHYGRFSLTAPPLTPEMFRTPGYPIFLAPLYVIDHSFTFAIVVQVLLVLGSVFLIHAIARSFLPGPWPTIVAFLYALDPTTIFYSLSIWSDTLFVFLLLAAIYLIFVRKSDAYAPYLLAGFLMGYATLVRSAAEYLVIVLAVCIGCAVAARGIRHMILTSFVFLLAFAATVVPWYARNFDETGVFALSSTGSYTLLFFDAREYLIHSGMTEAAASAQITSHLSAESIADPKNLRAVKDERTAFHDIVSINPLRYGVFHLIGSINLYIASSVRDLANNLPLLHERLQALHLMSDNSVNVKSLVLENPVNAIVYSVTSESLLTLERAFRLLTVLLAAVAVFFALFKKRARFLVLLCAIIVAYTALVIGPVSYPRYRMSAEPFLFMLAAAGAVALIPKRTVH